MDRIEGSSGPVTRSRVKRIKLMEQMAESNFPGEGIPSMNDLGDNAIINLLPVFDNLVCRVHVLSFLYVNDLLRLRRVCKSFKKIAEDFIRTQKVQTQQPLKIDLGNKVPLWKFNQFHRGTVYLPPRTTLHLKYCHTTSLLQPPTNCSNYITHLTIFELRLSIHQEWTLILESFPHVAHLVLGLVEFGHEMSSSKEMKIPSTLRNLKSLKILDGRAKWRRQATFHYILKLVESCILSLERLWLPFDQLWEHTITNTQTISLATKCILNTATNFKLGVTGRLLTELLRTEDRTPQMRSLDDMITSVNSKVIFLKNPHTTSFVHEFPNLERVDFVHIDDCILSDIEFSRNDWPKLKEIKIRPNCYWANPRQLLQPMWNFLFVGIIRENVIKLDFSVSCRDTLNMCFYNASDIVTSCPNLQTLYVGGAFLNKVDVPHLWRGLPGLQKIRFYFCPSLKDEDLVGKDPENPAFLGLKNLKVLEFLHLVALPQRLTNDIFTKVLRHMPLHELTLTSYKNDCDRNEFTSITLEGIKSLLSGKFASTVEKISIDRLLIKGVKKKELKNLERQFRSSQMC